MSRTQKLKGLAAASLRLKTLNDNPYVTEETLTRPPNNLKLVQPTKVQIHNQLADKAKVRLPTFSHNLHLAAHHIYLTLNNILQITTRRLYNLATSAGIAVSFVSMLICS